MLSVMSSSAVYYRLQVIFTGSGYALDKNATRAAPPLRDIASTVMKHKIARMRS